jgi:hypothetical protein
VSTPGDAITERNQQIAGIMAEVARLHGHSRALIEQKYAFWVRPFSEMCPVPGQRPDTPLTDIVITKGAKLTQDDYKLATHLSKKEGISFE